MAVGKKTKRIGEILVDSGLITKKRLEEAIDEGKRTGIRLGNVLVESGFVTEEDITKALSEQFEMPYVLLDNVIIDPELIKHIPEVVARKHKIIPIAMEDDKLVVATFDPLNVFAMDDIRKSSEMDISPVVCSENSIQQAIDQHYSVKGDIDEIVTQLDSAEFDLMSDEEELPEVLEKIAGETPIIKIVNMIIFQAIRDKASDIHIEPQEGLLRVRMRIDGILHEVSSLPVKLQPAITSRIKIIGNLDIAEKRVSQDGRFNIKVGNSDVDIRLSTLPTVFGEKCVMRILDRSSMLLEIDELGMPDYAKSDIIKMVKKPFGMTLITGPTGSGKTTTVYTVLNKINTLSKNIVTVEDPVEYQLKIINQVQVNPKAGVTFADSLRTILRQDPDIIMIGEIRDRETAEIAINAALTGHLVISTLHTNDAAGTINRLLDMNIEPFLISSSINCIVGQRLVRKICPSCKVEVSPDKYVLEDLGIKSTDKIPTLYKGEGCKNCRDTGYKGRVGIYEVLTINDDIRHEILKKSDSATIRNTALKDGFKPLREDGIAKVFEGITTIEEIMQATQEV
ncbi:GspE/PulE family protein [Thermodesulfobacteriota bacterium]